MRRFAKAWVPAFAALVFLLAACPTNAQWTWEDRNGKTRTRAELDYILREHHAWLADRHGGVIADLTEADLTDADLRNEDLSDAFLRDADLIRAHLNDAHLDGAHLNGADLFDAYLNDAHLNDAHLDGAHLIGADLDGAHLDKAFMKNADLGYADLGHVEFEPKSLPDLRGIAAAKKLELLTYKDNPDALFQLRKQFKDGGFREQERKITYALKRREAELSWHGCTSWRIPEKEKRPEDKTRAILWSSDSTVANCSSYVLNRAFFDLTCQYGWSPGRPLVLGIVLWLVCSLLYFACIRTSGEAGLYLVYPQSVQGGSSGERRVERVSPPAITQTRVVPRLLQYIRREWAVLHASMFFSLMSAFNIGFRDINFGRWLRSLTRQEFDMKAVGWARVISGWQSLLSVYFLALWVLSYFGRPFG